MSTFRNLSLRASLAAFAGLAISAMLVVGAVSLLAMHRSEALATRVLGDVKLARALGDTDMMHDALRADGLAALLAGAQAPEAKRAEIVKDLDAHVKRLQDDVAVVDGAAHDPAVRAALDAVKPAVAAYGVAARALVQAALAGQAGDAQQDAFEQAFGHLEDRLGKLAALVEASAHATVDEQAALFTSGRWQMGAALAVGSALLALFSLALLRRTLGLLGAEPRELRRFSLQIAQGRLGGRFEHTPAEDSVAGAMLRMQHTLGDAVLGIRRSADAVASASQQLAQGNQDLSQRTEEQAAALQQTTASMGELAGTIGHNHSSASQADALARAASSAAASGGERVAQVVTTMKGINDSSRKIADIIGVIDGIAFQTNILALNAAVEAARAGEQGRGFAVVAGEVRSLAGRSAAAAKEIKALIGASVDRVGQGSTQVDQAGAAMAEVLASIRRVTEIVADISRASAVQTQGVGQVGQAVQQLDHSTQQNAALVEQGAAAAQSLQQQASALVQAVAVFQLAPADR